VDELLWALIEAYMKTWDDGRSFFFGGIANHLHIGLCKVYNHSSRRAGEAPPLILVQHGQFAEASTPMVRSWFSVMQGIQKICIIHESGNISDK